MKEKECLKELKRQKKNKEFLNILYFIYYEIYYPCKCVIQSCSTFCVRLYQVVKDAIISAVCTLLYAVFYILLHIAVFIGKNSAEIKENYLDM